jgi:hypothetical protein
MDSEAEPTGAAKYYGDHNTFANRHKWGNPDAAHVRYGS